MIERLLAITLYLAELNLAFRGNILGLVQLLGQFDETMREHLKRVITKETADHYCGKSIQNEFISLLGKNVLNTIVNRRRKAKYFSVILDCTPDLSHKEKMSFIIRFVDIVPTSMSI